MRGNMPYVMVTNFRDHWDLVDNRETYYWKSMKHFEAEPRAGTPTTFILVEKGTVLPQKAWTGFVDGFRYAVKNQKDSIVFKVHINQAIPIPDRHRTLSSGWYLVAEESAAPTESPLEPAFFKTLRETSDWDVFEGDCHKLLKLLGIHEIHEFKKQRGKPDGFFKIGSLAVIYDATLESDFTVTKKDQMKNYSGQLSIGTLEYEDGTVNVRDCQKSVWIITRGSSKRITKMDNVTVKEVGVSQLMEIYRNRIERNLGEDQLVDELKALG